MGTNIVETKQWLNNRYGNSAQGKSINIDWNAEFKRGRINTDDPERSGRLKSAVVPENITKVHKIDFGDRKLKVREIAVTLKISEGSVFTIWHECLGMRKLFSKWEPHLLTPDQKQQRVKDSERCLELFKRGKKKTKRSSAAWTAVGENRPKRPKTQQWAGKIMASVFWDAHGILFIDYLEKGETINRDYYVALLDRLRTEIKKKWPHMQKKCALRPRHMRELLIIPTGIIDNSSIFRMYPKKGILFPRFSQKSSYFCACIRKSLFLNDY